MAKTIGVLGGMGSYATHTFFGKLLEEGLFAAAMGIASQTESPSD